MKAYAQRFFLLANLMLSSLAAEAVTLEVINEDFEAPFSGYTTQTNVSPNASGSMGLGQVVGSNGVVFGGSWVISPNTIVYSAGILSPDTPPALPYQANPANLAGITDIEYTADVILNGFTGDNIEHLFVQLLIYQQQANGSVDVFTQLGVTTMVENLSLDNISVSLQRKDFENVSGQFPDLSPDARPISFGLQLGALHDGSAFTGSRQGHLRVDNWTVTVTSSDLLFRDQFEADD